MFQLLRHTGIRVGTLVGLRVDEVLEALDSIEPYLELRDEICKGAKGGYTLFLNKRALTALQELSKIRKKMGATSEHLVVGSHGGQLTTRSVQQRMNHWTNSANVCKQASPHWWRHTKAMRIMENSEAKDPRAVVKRVLGHKNLASTEIYTKPTKQEFERSASA